MLKWSLFNHFEWLHECQRQGISVSDFHAMMPWHLTTFIDVRNIKYQQAKANTPAS